MPGASDLPRLSGTRAGLQTGAYDKYSGYSSIEYDEWGRVTGGHSRTPMGILSTQQTLCRSGKPVTASAQLVTGSGRSYNMTSVYTYDNAGRSSAWTVTLGKEKAGAEYTYGKTGRVQTETFANGVKRRFAYDCHDWVESISTEIPNSLLIPSGVPTNSSGEPVVTAGDGSSLPALSSGEVSTDFYSAALSGGLVVDTTQIDKLKTTIYTERVLYADGDNPRYDGTASAHVSTLNGRYDYTYDCHDRLIKADYTKVLRPRELSLQPVSVEDFSTSYTYNAVGAPLTLKRQGVIAPAAEDGSTGAQYGLMDNLSYQWDGMLLASVSAQACGSEFYGRTGYSLSAKGGTGSYKWNGAGLLNADSARGIRKTYYNESGQPTSIEFTDKGHLDYTYSTSGELIRVSTYAMLPGGRRPTPVSERSYCGGFVFEGDSLIYANFPGGYFDGEGLAHYSHTDFQGNITMVTDRDGQICQHTGYYPYGEPWREPAGQPYLYGGKERMRDGSLNDYDFSARHLNSALALWTAPDPMARDFSNINPYVYCASNPIRYTDPTGCSFTEGSQVYVDMLVADVKRQLKDNSKEILNSLQDLMSGNLSKKKVKDFNKKISDINKKNNDLKEVLSEIDVLSNSSQEYNITENSRLNTNTHFNSGTTFNPESKAIDITLGEVSLGHIAHELKHAFQFETGEISFGLFKDGSPFYDKSDEWEAYKRGAMFGQKMPKVLPDRYNQYQDGPCKVSDLGTEYLNDSKELQNYARLYRCAFRWKGKTYISTKLIGK